jgi:nicotinamidase-related amidase
VPPFYDPAHARSFGYRPDQQKLFELASGWRAAHEVPPASQDHCRIRLLLVDEQKDFCFPEGSLYVGGRSGSGAMDDSDRLARFVYQNLGAISEITCTMDTHYPYQVFSPAFWRDETGAPPSPHREVGAEEVRSGKLVPDPELAAWASRGDRDWLARQLAFYCDELERGGKYKLYLWPIHCILGSDGHALAGVIQEARMFHAYVRRAPNGVEIKGGHTLTENYSVLVDALLAEDVLVVAGQAASHCVRFTLEDLLGEIRRRDASLARKLYLLTDCMSAVAVPDPERGGRFLADFTPQVEEALAGFAEAGMHLVDTRTPLSEWPGIPALQ